MKNDMKMCGISIKKDLHKRILAEAKKERRSFSAMLSIMADNYLSVMFISKDGIRRVYNDTPSSKKKKAGK